MEDRDQNEAYTRLSFAALELRGRAHQALKKSTVALLFCCRLVRCFHRPQERSGLLVQHHVHPDARHPPFRRPSFCSLPLFAGTAAAGSVLFSAGDVASRGTTIEASAAGAGLAIGCRSSGATGEASTTRSPRSCSRGTPERTLSRISFAIERTLCLVYHCIWQAVLSRELAAVPRVVPRCGCP